MGVTTLFLASVRSSATLSVLEEVLLHASEPERQFFAMLNGELDKVSRFYNGKISSFMHLSYPNSNLCNV